MYQIILLVLLAPVLYLFLKISDRAACGAACGTFRGVALPELNLDALIYYSFAAYAALHGRKWAEAVWSWKRAALGVCLLAVGIVLSRSHYTHYFVPGIVLYQLLAVIDIWMMVNERWLGEVRPFMTCTFFLSMRRTLWWSVSSIRRRRCYFGQPAGFDVYVCVHAAACSDTLLSGARVLRRYRPDIWKTLNGDVDKSRIYG